MTTSIDDVLEPATPTTDAAAGEPVSGFARRCLETLVVLPGAEHVVVVDATGQRVLAEWGDPDGSTDTVLDRARRAADPSRQGRRQLEDTTSTTASAFHLSCFVLAGPGHPESVWVAVRVSRARGNLTWSKGALARLTGSAGRAPTSTPTDDGHPAPAAAQGVVPPPTAPAPAMPVAPPAAVPPKARIALRVRAVAAPEPPLVPGTDTAAGTGGEPDTADTTIVEPAVTVEMVTPAPAVPAARLSSENRPDPSAPGPQRTSSFAPVMVVLPPPAPIPDDGTFEEPAPMPAPIIVAPDVPAPVEATVDPGADGADGPGPTRRRIHGLRRRPTPTPRPADAPAPR